MIIDPSDFQKIVILTGAGISAESGISTFRDSGGLWEKHRLEEVATPEAFSHDPVLVWRFYSMRRKQAAAAQPNSAHQGLVDYARTSMKHVSLITQNVDVLHQRADPLGYLPPHCMHGSLHQSRCTQCQRVYLDDHSYFDEDGFLNPVPTGLLTFEQRNSSEYLHRQSISIREIPLSPCCHGPLRPHIVWFGEVPHLMDLITRVIEDCDLFVSVGTSGQVYPAAGFLQMAKLTGATTICINKDPLSSRAHIDQFLEGKAGDLVPKFFRIR